MGQIFFPNWTYKLRRREYEPELTIVFSDLIHERCISKSQQNIISYDVKLNLTFEKYNISQESKKELYRTPSLYINDCIISGNVFM